MSSSVRRPGSQHLWILLILGICLLAARACVFRPATSFPCAHFNRGTNAAWLDIVWVMEPRGQSEIRDLADGLAKRQISTVFAYASYLKPSGQFNPTYSHASEFVSTVKAAQPGMNVQAWIGLPVLDEAMVGESGYVDLADPSTRASIAAFCADVLRQGGFDGVHLDPEPIRDGNANLLSLLDEARGAVGPNSTLSIATRRIVPLFSEAHLPLLDRFGWSGSYYREVARRVDQIALMTYDSGLPLGALYRLWGRFEVVELTRALDGLATEVFVGIPTSEERTWTHWPNAESMSSGLQGLLDGLNDAEARPDVITGISIYPHWETDEAEWATYEAIWLGRR